MSTRLTNPSSYLQRARDWRPTPQGLAGAAAASGDPGALLALDAYAVHDPQGNGRNAPEHHGDPTRGQHR